MNNNFLITIHNYESEIYEKHWMSIEDFIEIKGTKFIDEYYDIETDFISVIKDFSNFFSENEYFNSLVGKIEIYEYDSDYNFYGLDGDYEKLKKLNKYSFNYISDSEKEFIYRCQCRGMCSFWLIDVLSMSYMKNAMDPYFLHVYLDPKIKLKSIFKKNPNIHYYYDKDTFNTNEDYIYPENCGDKVQDLN